MDVSKINPYIRVAMQGVLPTGCEIKRRIIFDYELIYIEDGEFTFTYNDIAYPCKTGDFIFIRPRVPHSFSDIHRDLLQPHIHFDMRYAEDSTTVPISYKDLESMTDLEKSMIRKDYFRDFPKTPFVRFADIEQTLTIFYEIIKNQSLSPLMRKAKMLALIDMLITDNFSGTFEKNDTTYPIEIAVKDYLDAGQGMSLSLEDIAKQFGYSKYYLDRRFKEAFGISLIAYRNDKRMELAKELLTEKSVSDVSETLGFSSIYVFSRAFKNHFGVAPTKM